MHQFAYRVYLYLAICLDLKSAGSVPRLSCFLLRQAIGMVMQRQFSNPELEAKVEQWLADTGRPVEELVEDAMAGSFEELTQVRENPRQPLRRRQERQGQAHSRRGSLRTAKSRKRSSA